MTAQSSPSARSNFMNCFRSPMTGKTDIIMSIMPLHMDNIAKGVKNHEYRRYLLPASVKRIWFYTSHPEARIEYIASISSGRTPGEVPNDGGLGNEDFNAGRKVSKFGYEILKLWRLANPIDLQTAIRRGYLRAPPQKYNYAKPELLRDIPLNQQHCLINRVQKREREHDVVGKDGIMRQGVEPSAKKAKKDNGSTSTIKIDRNIKARETKTEDHSVTSTRVDNLSP